MAAVRQPVDAHQSGSFESHQQDRLVTDVARLAGWAPPWAHWVSASFLGGYLDRAKDSSLVPRKPADLEFLLEFFLLEKCIYEAGYEINNRPEWLEIPLRGLIAHAGLTL